MRKNGKNGKQGSYTDTVGNDRYLITYSDLLTLLLGLFVILYASSRVDKEKYDEFSQAFSEYFQVKDPKILQGGDGVLGGHRKGVPAPILAPTSAKSIEEIKSETKGMLKRYIEQGNLEIREEESSITLVFPEKMLFASGKATVEDYAMPMLDTVANVLSSIPYQIMIDGHTDSQPIKTFRYESNWHLSSDRALNVAYELIAKGVPEPNLVVRAFGAQRPIAENVTPEGKSRNRRVEITISANDPEMGVAGEKDDN